MDVFYLATVIVILLLMISMTIHVLGYSGFNNTQKGWFIATFVAVSFCALAEFAVHYNGNTYNEQFSVPLTILTVLQFSLSPCLAVLFAGALGVKNQNYLGTLFFAMNLLMQLICVPFGWIFKFNAGTYERGPAFIAYIISYFGSLLYMIFVLFIVGKKFNHRDLGTILMVFVVLVAGVLPMTIANVRIAYLAVGISACICYVYYNDLIQQDTSAELSKNQKRVTEIQMHITSGLANLIESRDTETGGHVSRTRFYVKTLANDAKADGKYTDILTDEFIALLVELAPMHDVGKILVSDKILCKPGRLTPEEFEEMKKHAKYGGRVVSDVLKGVTEEKYIAFASDIATYHHERWDGNGYPYGLKEDDIPLCARLMAIADVFDALISKRCYKDAIPPEEAFEIMKEESGTHFDPNLVSVFLNHKENYIKVDDSVTGDKIF